MVWRYWCDHCRKGSLSRHAMEKHERHCTLNSNRECRACLLAETKHAGLVALLEIARDAERSKEQAVADMMAAAKGCPVCVLAAIRQSGRNHFDIDSGGPGLSEVLDEPFPFEFKVEMKKFFAKLNEEADANTYY